MLPAEEPNVPNIHIQHGATLVGYSGGKCMRGPQSSGLLIGQKDLCGLLTFRLRLTTTTDAHSNASKEEIMGLLVAVRQWYKRDHAAEQRQCASRGSSISEGRVNGLPSVRVEYLQPEDLSNRRHSFAFTGMQRNSRSPARSSRLVSMQGVPESLLTAAPACAPTVWKARSPSCRT